MLLAAPDFPEIVMITIEIITRIELTAFGYSLEDIVRPRPFQSSFPK